MIDGRYRVDSALAENVLRATDVVLERPVAIKLYPGDQLERVRAAARAMARLRHENIAHVYSCGLHEGRAFVVTELGSALAETMPSTAAIGIIEKIAAALDYAHAEGVVHGNLKPSNVLVGARYRVMLTDFGTAASPSDDPSALAVMAERMLGETCEAKASCTALAAALREAWAAKREEMAGPGILIVDDDPAIRRVFRALLADAFPEARIATATDGLVALELVRATSPALLVLDLQMPNLNGIELLHQLAAESLRPRIIAVSGLLGRPASGAMHVGVMLKTLGVTEQLAKPVAPAALMAAARRQLG